MKNKPKNRVTANFGLFTELWEEEINKTMGIEPDNFVIAGKHRAPPRPRPPENGWILRNEIEGCYDIQEVLIPILDMAYSKREEIASLAKKDKSLETGIAISLAPRDADVATFFTKEVIAKIAELKASLDIEYFYL